MYGFLGQTNSFMDLPRFKESKLLRCDGSGEDRSKTISNSFGDDFVEAVA